MEWLNVAATMVIVLCHFNNKRQEESAGYLRQMVNMMIQKHVLDRERTEQLAWELSTLRPEIASLKDRE